MAILKSISGEFYEVPDKQLDKFLIPEDKVKEKLSEANLLDPADMPEGPPPGPYPGYAPVVVQFVTPGQAMGYGGPPPAPEEAVNPYGFHFGWGGHGGHGGGHWGGHHGGHGGHWGGHHGGHWGGHGGHWGGHGHCW